jgi:glucose dehydrogenase
MFVGEGSDAYVTTARVPPGMPFDAAPNYGEPWFRAFDKQTGQLRAEIPLPAGTTGAPMTYLYRGKQYIVVAIGGREHDPEWVALGVP